MSDDARDLAEVFSRANPDYWYLEALPAGAVAEIDGRRYRKNNAGQWELDYFAKHGPPDPLWLGENSL